MKSDSKDNCYRNRGKCHQSQRNMDIESIFNTNILEIIYYVVASFPPDFFYLAICTYDSSTSFHDMIALFY